MTSTYHPAMYQPPSGMPVLHSVTDAVIYLGVSASTVRRHLRRHSARIIRTTSGMVSLSEGSRTGYVPVSV